MKKAKVVALSCVVATLMGLVSTVRAAEPTVQEILNGITTGGSSGATLVSEGSDALWAVGASGGSVQVLFTRNSAAADAFGLYDGANPLNSIQVFSGTDAVGSQKFVSINALGQVSIAGMGIVGTFSGNLFGFYESSTMGTWYSQTALNGDNQDHMLAYRGNGSDEITLPGLFPGVWGTEEYALFFEDVGAGGDYDYNDIGVLVESVHPVPDGGVTVILLGAALSGLALIRRKVA